VPNVPAWKRFETRVAKALNGQRIPVTGIDRDGADVVTPMFHVQTKRRNGMPSYLREWLDGICLTAKCAQKIGVVIWTSPGKRDESAVVVMRLSDFIELHGCPDVDGGQDESPETVVPNKL
jgi:hypothetical protein